MERNIWKEGWIDGFTDKHGENSIHLLLSRWGITKWAQLDKSILIVWVLLLTSKESSKLISSVIRGILIKTLKTLVWHLSREAMKEMNKQ